MPKNKNKFPCLCCQYYTWQQFEADAKKLSRKISKIIDKYNFDSIWAPPRGGLTIAVKLSHLLDITFSDKKKPESKRTIIVDDIADTGKCLNSYSKEGYFIITIFYHKQSSFVPDIWLHEKKEKYVIFPWEKWQCARKCKFRLAPST